MCGAVLIEGKNSGSIFLALMMSTPASNLWSGNQNIVSVMTFPVFPVNCVAVDYCLLFALHSYYRHQKKKKKDLISQNDTNIFTCLKAWVKDAPHCNCSITTWLNAQDMEDTGCCLPL